MNLIPTNAAAGEILILALFSETLGTASGLGSSILFLPMAQYFIPLHLAMALTAILHVFANSFRLFLFWSTKSIAHLKTLGPIFLVTTGIGAVLALKTTPSFHELILGFVLVVSALQQLYFLWRNSHVTTKQGPALVGVAGLLTGWFGTGGALRAIALSAFHFSKYEFVFVSSGIDLAGDALRAIIYARDGFIDVADLSLVPALGLSAYVGSYIGKKLLKKIPQALFEQLVLVLSLGMGVISIAHYFIRQ